jgi:O-antigen/teichoic acid export membrane protein
MLGHRLLQFSRRASLSFTGRLLKNSAWGMTGNIILVGLGVLQVGLVTRALGVAQYGELAVITVFPTIIQNFAGFRTWEFIARYCTEALERGAREEAGHLAIIGWTIDLAVAAAAYLVVLLAASTYLQVTLGHSRYTSLLVVYGLIMLSTAIMYNSQALLQVLGRFDLLSIQMTSMALLRLILIAIVYWRGWGLTGVILSLVIASGIEAATVLGMCLVQARGKIRFKLNRSVWAYARAHWREFSSFLSAGYMEATVQALSRNLDVVVVATLRGPADAGLYRVATQIVSYTANLLTPLSQVALPDIQRSIDLPRAALLRRMGRLSLVTGALFLAGSVVIFLGAPWMISLVVGPSFQSAADITRIMIWSVAIVGATFWLAPLLLVLKRPWIRTATMIVSGAVQLAVLVALVPRLGIRGAALAFLVPVAIRTLLMLGAVLGLRWPAALSPVVEVVPAHPPSSP